MLPGLGICSLGPGAECQSSPKQGRGVDVIQAFVEVPAQSSSRAGQFFSEQHLEGSEKIPRSSGDRKSVV